MPSVFTPDVLFMGTTMTEVGVGHAAVTRYFTPGLTGPNARKPGDATAKFVDAETLVLNDNAVLVTGRWRVDRVTNGQLVPGAPLRATIAAVKRNDRWLIAQFHNSATPVPAPATPAPPPGPAR